MDTNDWCIYLTSSGKIQGRSYDFVIGTAIGEGSGDRLSPQRGPGQGPG